MSDSTYANCTRALRNDCFSMLITMAYELLLIAARIAAISGGCPLTVQSCLRVGHPCAFVLCKGWSWGSLLQIQINPWAQSWLVVPSVAATIGISR